MNRDIVISIKTVLLTIGLFIGIYLLYILAPIFVILLFSTILVIALEPGVKFFIGKTFLNKPLSRNFAVVFTYILFIISVLFILTIGLPPVLTQAQKLTTGLRSLLSTVPGLDGIATSLIPQVSSVSGDVIGFASSFVSNVFSILSVLFISLYMSLDWKNIKSRAFNLFSGKTRDEIEDAVDEIEHSIGHWVKGQLVLMATIGLVSFFGLLLLGIDYPLALGLIAGLLEIVPVLGPIVSAFLAAIIGFSMSPVKGFAAVGLFLLIQQLENSFLVPKVMQKVSGFSPLVILIALLVGSKLFGIMGAVVAVPIMMVLVIIIKRALRVST